MCLSVVPLRDCLRQVLANDTCQLLAQGGGFGAPPPARLSRHMQTIPAKSVALGRNLGHATARSPAEFEVEARNAAERPSKQGGDQIKVKFSAPANTTVATVSEQPEGRYKVEYVAPIAGTYQLSVTMNGEHVQGSPFKLVVTLPRAQASATTDANTRSAYAQKRARKKT